MEKLKNMTKKQLGAIIGGALLLVISIVLVVNLSFTKANPATDKVDLSSAAVIDTLTFDEMKIVYENGLSTLTGTVSNDGDDYNLKTITMKLYDSNDRLLGTLTGYVGDVIKKTEQRNITSSIDIDVSSAVKISYTINK